MNTSDFEVRSSLHVADPSPIQLLDIDRIRVLNPRMRNRQVFAKLVENIASIGLKRPVTVIPNGADNDGPRYGLVCGQGRLEAFQVLGEEQIPCIVVNANEVDRFLIGLVENLARRKHSNRDLLNSIQLLADRGYSIKEISNKTSLDPAYINGILLLLRQGEERLIAAVEKGWLSIKLAVEIARSDDSQIQLAMMEAYESGVLKGDQLIKIRRLIDRRKFMGTQYGQMHKSSDRSVTPQKLLGLYKQEVRRQKVMVKKADISEQRLLILVTAMKKLLADDYFCTLLRTETIQDMPKALADRIQWETS
ncbi:plasmid partitioning protein RepB C-terminal domain-containing protein [Pseudomonas laurylsulfatiphila]|jgi:ParB family chromosome partitioning protein